MFQVLSGPKFPPGRIVITANAAQHLSDGDITSALRRHLRGDWGDLNRCAASVSSAVKSSRVRRRPMTAHPPTSHSSRQPDNYHCFLRRPAT